MKLWAGQTVSQFGSLITGEALPLTALLVLDASPAQMGLLGQVLGVRATLYLAVIGMIASILWLVFSPVRRLAALSLEDAAPGLVNEDGWELSSKR